MGKKNKFKKEEGGDEPKQQGQQQRPQGQPQQSQQQRPQGPPQQQQQRPQGPPQQQQQRPQGPPQQQQQRPQGPPQQQQQHSQAPPQQQRGGPQQSQQQWRKEPSRQQQQQRSQGPPQQQQQRGWPQQSQQQWRQEPSRQQHGQQQRSQGPPQQQQQRPQGPAQQQQQQRPQGPPQQYSRGQQGPSRPQQQHSRVEQLRPSPSPSKSSSVSSISSSVSSISGIPRGSLGRRKNVETNYLRLNLDQMPDIAYHYDVTITPDRPKKFFRPAFEQFNREHFKNIGIAFDGVKSCYTVELLPIEKEFEKEVKVDDGKGRTLTYKIAVKATGNTEIDLRSLRTYFKERVFDKPMRALQCLEVVLANPCHSKGIRVGRSFFIPPPNPEDLGGGYELFIGLYQAMVLGDEPFLNIDIAHKSFPKQISVINYLKNERNFDPRRKLEPRTRFKLVSFLKGLRITYKDPSNVPKEYNFLDVSEESASQRTFLHKESGKRMNVAEYFTKERKIGLQYPELNCLVVGSSVNSISLPIEFCEIGGGQATKKKDDTQQVQRIVKYAATSTNERKFKIMKLLERFQHNEDNLIQKFGIRIDTNFIDVPMRILDAPLIEYLNRMTARVNKGAWRMDNFKFLNTKPKQHKWAVIYSTDSRMNFTVLQNSLVRNLKDAAAGVGLDLDPKPLIDGFGNVDRKLLELKENKYDLVVVVIPFRGPTSYATIKKSAELTHGILTQCIKEETVERRCNMQTAVNLMLKINSKLNGTNHKIAANTHVPLQNVMFLGADVTHPSPDQKHIPSVVGVAASHDVNGASYNMQYRLQKSTVENIEEMDSIFSEHVEIYKSKLGKYPDHIIYYRDGVSDGQFPIVKRNELQSIRAVCSRKKIKPKITCIIVVKRHHTRFFPKEPPAPRDEYNNVEPGTVVDQVIVHPNEIQFFMVSHQSIKGTAKPTRYNVIEDDAKMDINDLQKLTHNLCHLFPRCNRAVSYPTPVYLAHLVAFRGRVYLEGTTRFGEPQREYEKRKVQPHFMASNPMYFV